MNNALNTTIADEAFNLEELFTLELEEEEAPKSMFYVSEAHAEAVFNYSLDADMIEAYQQMAKMSECDAFATLTRNGWIYHFGDCEPGFETIKL